MQTLEMETNKKHLHTIKQKISKHFFCYTTTRNKQQNKKTVDFIFITFQISASCNRNIFFLFKVHDLELKPIYTYRPNKTEDLKKRFKIKPKIFLSLQKRMIDVAAFIELFKQMSKDFQAISKRFESFSVQSKKGKVFEISEI